MSKEPHDTGRFQAFVTTQWTVVLAAAAGDGPSTARDALGQLCETYWYPLYAFARRKGCSPPLSEDLVQGFFAQLLRLNALKRVSKDQGRFRSFLLASFQHFLSDEYARSKAQKRGGDRVILSLDAVSAEERYDLQISQEDSPAVLFERQWALTLLNDTLAQLSDMYRSEGKRDFFDQCKSMLSGGDSAGTYADIGMQLGMTESAVKMAVLRMRRRYRDLLLQRIRATVQSADEVADELSCLMRAVAGHGGQ